MAINAFERSHLDSARFGYEVIRGKFTSIDCKAIARSIFDLNGDVAVIRVPSSAQGLQSLSRWALPVAHSDTLVYYRCDFANYTPKAVRNSDLVFRKATQEDLSDLRLVISQTFEGYVSHYHANPLFPHDRILAGYQEWAEGHAMRADSTLWIAQRQGRIVAFAACAESTVDGVAEGILYGVSRDESGGGIYGDLIRHTQADFAARGYASMLVSTQVGNFAVQKVWAREGFHLFEAWDTFHVNALLSSGEVVYRKELVFSREQVTAFATASGDVNPIHLDDLAARAAGFEGRISHGVLAAAELSRILGTDVPGPGTIFSRLDMAFLRPVIAGSSHTLTLRIAGGLKTSGHMHGVMDIRDDESRVCVYAHTDIVLRS